MSRKITLQLHWVKNHPYTTNTQRTNLYTTFLNWHRVQTEERGAYLQGPRPTQTCNNITGKKKISRVKFHPEQPLRVKGSTIFHKFNLHKTKLFYIQCVRPRSFIKYQQVLLSWPTRWRTLCISIKFTIFFLKACCGLHKIFTPAFCRIVAVCTFIDSKTRPGESF